MMGRDLPDHLETDVAALMQDGTVVHTVELGANRFAFPITDVARANEVCMVFRRPSGDVLTFRKTFYPRGVYRLPTGGIHPGEAILDAFRREAAEETGLSIDPHRLAAVVGYRAASGSPLSCYTFAFVVEDVQATPLASDPHEQVAEFRWAPVAALPGLAERLETLRAEHSPDLESPWRDWGVFRAVIHRVIWSVLRAKPPH